MDMINLKASLTQRKLANRTIILTILF